MFSDFPFTRKVRRTRAIAMCENLNEIEEAIKIIPNKINEYKNGTNFRAK